MKATLTLASASLLAALMVGCTTTIPVKSWQPGDISLNGANRMMVTDAEGRRSARETVAILMTKQAKTDGYFQVEDVSADGVKIEVAGRNASVENLEAPMAGNELFVRSDVLEWTAEKDTSTQTTGRGKNQKTKTVRVMRGTVLLKVTVADTKGRALLAEREFEGTAELRGDASRDEAIEAAAQVAVRQVLASITPQLVTANVRVDDSDKGQESFIRTARTGAVAQAATDLREYLKANDKNAPAHYNLAVFLDAMGDYENALEMYDRASSLGGQPWYTNARAACAQRLEAARAIE